MFFSTKFNLVNLKFKYFEKKNKREYDSAITTDILAA